MALASLAQNGKLKRALQHWLLLAGPGQYAGAAGSGPWWHGAFVALAELLALHPDRFELSGRPPAKAEAGLDAVRAVRVAVPRVLRPTLDAEVLVSRLRRLLGNEPGRSAGVARLGQDQAIQAQLRGRALLPTLHDICGSGVVAGELQVQETGGEWVVSLERARSAGAGQTGDCSGLAAAMEAVVATVVEASEVRCPTSRFGY